MTITRTHTPTPWHMTERSTVDLYNQTRPNYAVLTGDGQTIAVLGAQSHANAAHLVHCVNTHAALVAALQLLRTEIHAADIDVKVLEQVDHALATGKE